MESNELIEIFAEKLNEVVLSAARHCTPPQSKISSYHKISNVHLELSVTERRRFHRELQLHTSPVSKAKLKEATNNLKYALRQQDENDQQILYRN